MFCLNELLLLLSGAFSHSGSCLYEEEEDWELKIIWFGRSKSSTNCWENESRGSTCQTIKDCWRLGSAINDCGVFHFENWWFKKEGCLWFRVQVASSSLKNPNQKGKFSIELKHKHYYTIADDRSRLLFLNESDYYCKKTLPNNYKQNNYKPFLNQNNQRFVLSIFTFILYLRDSGVLYV